MLLLLGGYAVLAGILVPLAPPRERGCRVPTCLSNLNQLSKAGLMYTMDWGEHYPPSQSWQDNFYPYLKRADVFFCPQRQPTPAYAFNLCLNASPVKAVGDTGAQPVLFESDQERQNAADPLISFTAPHSGGGNIGYADGHVKWIRTPPAADAGLRRRPPSRPLP